MIHPELRRAGIVIRRLFKVKEMNLIIRVQRLWPRFRKYVKTKGLRFNEFNIPTPDNPCLRLCVYRALEAKPDAVGLLWIHGGGFLVGSPEMDIGYYRRFINAANCVAVSPDYRLSTCAPYPAALNDCYNTLLWMKEHAAKLGIRTDQLFVGGVSAGGGLAAAVTLIARDNGEVNVAFQMPLYPMLDDRMATPSSKDNDAPVWNTRANKIAWKHYLGGLHGTTDVPPYAAPSRATDFSGLPPAYTFVGDIEPFYDETRKYIANLQNAGVPAEIDIYPGCFHAFDMIGKRSEIARQATQKYIEAFRFAVAHYCATQPCIKL
jgi:acetyl esterase/lipase